MYNNLPALSESILWDDNLLATDYTELDAEALGSALRSYLQAVSVLRGEWHPLHDSPLSLWIARHDQLALYRPGLLSAERIILTDTLEEAVLRLDTIESSEAMDRLIHYNATDRLADIRTGVAQFVRFVKDNFLLIQAGFIAFTPCESVRQEQERKMQLLQDNPDRHFLNAVMPAEVVRLYERSVKVRGSDGSAMKGISASCQKNTAGRNHAGAAGLSEPFYQCLYVPGAAASRSGRRRQIQGKDHPR